MSEKRRSKFLNQTDQVSVQSKKPVRRSVIPMEMELLHSPKSSLVDDEASEDGNISSGNEYIDADKDLSEAFDND